VFLLAATRGHYRSAPCSRRPSNRLPVCFVSDEEPGLSMSWSSGRLDVDSLQKAEQLKKQNSLQQSNQEGEQVRQRPVGSIEPTQILLWTLVCMCVCVCAADRVFRFPFAIIAGRRNNFKKRRVARQGMIGEQETRPLGVCQRAARRDVLC